MESSIDHSDPSIAILPIVAKLRLPSKLTDFVYIFEFKLVDHVSVMHIQDDQSFNGASIQRRDIGSCDLDDLRELEVQSVVVFL